MESVLSWCGTSLLDLSSPKSRSVHGWYLPLDWNTCVGRSSQASTEEERTAMLVTRGSRGGANLVHGSCEIYVRVVLHSCKHFCQLTIHPKSCASVLERPIRFEAYVLRNTLLPPTLHAHLRWIHLLWISDTPPRSNEGFTFWPVWLYWL